jgi:hypothetical protein
MRTDRLDLLRRLTAATPEWTLVKGEQAALDGRGDVDSAAPREAWPKVTQAVSEWSCDTGRGPTVACGHLPGTLVLAVVESRRHPTLVQVDVLDHRLLRGRPILRAHDLLRSTETAPEGFRRLSPGAEAVARLVLVEWSAAAPRPEPSSLEEVASLVRADRDGARSVAAALDPRLAQVVTEIEAGRWPRTTLALVELEALVQGLRRPTRLLARLAAAPSRRRCPLLRALANERTVRGNLDAWLAAVHHAHLSMGLSGGYR